MIFSKNAPELESLLHKEFNDRRINKVNFRKEYFNVTLDEIEQVVKDKYEKEVDFIKISEAQQFRETQSIIKQIEKEKKKNKRKRKLINTQIIYYKKYWLQQSTGYNKELS